MFYRRLSDQGINKTEIVTEMILSKHCCRIVTRSFGGPNDATLSQGLLNNNLLRFVLATL